MEKELEQLGFTKNQAIIYLELLKHPEQTGGELSKKINLDRSFTYGILKNLISKGLISFIIKDSKRIYSASHPENLLKDTEEKMKFASKVVSELNQIKSSPDVKNSVEVFEGSSSLKKLVREILKEKEFYILGGGGQLKTIELLKYEYQHYIKEATSKKINGKIIVSEKNSKFLKNTFKNSEVKIKTLKKKESQINFVIYGDKVAIYSSQKPYLIDIKNKDISNAFKAYFDILWNIDKSTIKN